MSIIQNLGMGTSGTLALAAIEMCRLGKNNIELSIWSLGMGTSETLTLAESIIGKIKFFKYSITLDPIGVKCL